MKTKRKRPTVGNVLLITAALIALIMLMFSCNPVMGQCPVKGDKANTKFQHLDSLKNRSDVSNDIVTIDVQNFFSPNQDDRNTFTTDTYMQTTAFVKLVKWGGAETCNCHSKNKGNEDYHIEVIPSLDYTGKPMICEINRFVRPVTYDSLKTMVGKQVTITGWLFFDEEHWSNAVHTNPKGTNDWRETSWELHPVISIRLVNE